MHEALRHAVSELKSYFPYDTISATQVGFSTVQLHMPEETLDELVHLLKNGEDAPDLRDELREADDEVTALTNEVSRLRGELVSARDALASARRQMDYWMDELESNAIEVRPPRV